jgi:hypothetical protein
LVFVPDSSGKGAAERENFGNCSGKAEATENAVISENGRNYEGKSREETWQIRLKPSEY